MKKVLKFFAVFFSVAAVLALSALCLFYSLTSDVVLDESKLHAKGSAIVFYDSEGNEITTSDGFSGKKTDFSLLPSYVKNAFIAVEDKRFYNHNGVDLRALIRAAVTDVKTRSLREGGSTISQQLVKNTHLSGEKTILRKLKELKLTAELEKRYSKDEILEFYLDGIYFGKGAYGVENAANRYFSKPATELTIGEAAALAATVKSPGNYNPEAEGSQKRKNLVLKLMLEQGYINQSEYDANKDEITCTAAVSCDYFSLARNELYSECDVSPYETRKIEVYTYFDKKAQDSLASLCESNGGTDAEICKNGLIASRFGHIKAAVFPYGDNFGMPASAIKPILVYAPAFNDGVITPATLIDDSPTDFGGYAPKNYGDTYYGYISAKECLVKSLNVPAVKILEAEGVGKCIEYAKRAGIQIDEDTLNVALGAFGNGVRFTDLCSAYTVFNSQGIHYPPKFIKSVRIGRLTVYTANENGTEVFTRGTVDLINDALEECAKTGTAKALSDFGYVYAKTGTNGTKAGNTDAIAVCYTSEDIIGIRLCPTDGTLLPCSVTGSTAAREACAVIEKLYNGRAPDRIAPSDESEKLRLCKIAYEDGKLQLAPEEQPDKYCITALFAKTFEPDEFSDRFTFPRVKNTELKKDKNTVTLTFDKHSSIKCEIIRKSGEEEKTIADTGDRVYKDKMLKDGRYSYYILPYTSGKNGEKFYGEKKFLAEVIVCEKQNYAENGNWQED